MSKFYLRHFADDAEQVKTVMLPGDTTFVQSIGDASVRTDFYTAIGHDGQPTDAAEQAFGLIEGPAADAWGLVANGVWPLPPERREYVAGWIALQLLRGSGNRDSMSQMGTGLLQLDITIGGRGRLREVLRNLGEPHDDESVTREWIDLFKDPLEIEVHANHHLKHLADMLPRVTASLLDRWWLLSAYERRALATSDHPVYVVPNPQFAALGMGTGIENANVIYVPLTRRLALSMHLRARLPSDLSAVKADLRVAGVTATALYSNSCTVNSARRFIFHHPDDSPLDGHDLHGPRDREVSSDPDPWRFMPDDDRQVLLDAGIEPPRHASESGDDTSLDHP